jgi:hypothetical protein
VLAAAVIGSVADAGPTGPVHIYPPAMTPDCAAGFSKTGVSGPPNGAHSYACRTPVLRCPQGPPGFEASMRGQAVQTGGGWQFSYSCFWATPLR